MKLKAERRRVALLSLTPLIDVVFIVLVFFLLTSKIRPFSDSEVQLARALGEPVASAIPHSVIVHADGRRFVRGIEHSGDDLLVLFADWAGDGVKRITIVADGSLAARSLVKTVTLANSTGIPKVRILTRKPD